MRLKFRSLSLLDHQNLSKPIPHCSNFVKIVFWAYWSLFCIGSKNFFYKKVFYRPKEHDSRWTGPKFTFNHHHPLPKEKFKDMEGVVLEFVLRGIYPLWT